MENETVKYLDLYNYVFIFSNYTLTIEAESKIEAINKLQKEYARKFEEDFKVYRIDRVIKNDNTEISYL